MAIVITVEKIKNKYLNIDMSTTKYDDMIELYITGVVNSVIDYLDDPDYTAQSNLPENLEHRICQQIAYEYRRRKDIGLSSVQIGEGSVSKFVIDEWIPSVKDALDRNLKYTI